MALGPESTGRAAVAFLAYGLLTFALHLSPGLLRSPSGQIAAETWLALLLVLASLVLALVTACRKNGLAIPSAGLNAGLAIVLGTELLWMLVSQPSYYRTYQEHDPPLMAFRSGVVLLFALAGSYLWRDMPWPAGRPLGFLAIYAFLGSWVIVTADVKPQIDVWQLQQNACAYLLSGKNPYDAEYPQFYSQNAGDFIGPELLKDGKIRSFPYPPLSIVLTVPGYLLGDVRWSYLAAIIGSAALMLVTGRRLGLPAGHPAELAVLTFLCHPHGLLVLETGWTEPFLLLALTACLWSVAAGNRLLPFSVAAIVALKQYGLLALPSVWKSGRVGHRSMIGALTLAALTALPFLIWEPVAFWRGVVGFHVYSPFRTDCLSIPAVVAVTTGFRLSPIFGFLGAFATAAIVFWRQRPGLAPVTLGSAAVFLAFFLLNKAAHLNYYWLAAALLAFGTLLTIAEDHKADGVSPAL